MAHNILLNGTLFRIHQNNPKAYDMIIRTKKRETPFAMIDKCPLKDERLSWKARGIMAYLLSKPDNWEVRIGDLINRGPDGKTAVQSAMKELRELGYAKLKTARNEKGHVIGKYYEITERPVSRPTEKPTDGKTDRRKTGLTNNTDTSTNNELSTNNNISLNHSESEKEDFLISQLKQDPKLMDWPLLLRQPNMKVDKIIKLASEFIKWKSGVGEDDWNSYNDFRKNLYRWLPKKLGYEQSRNNTRKNKKTVQQQQPITVEERLAEARRKYSR